LIGYPESEAERGKVVSHYDDDDDDDDKLKKTPHCRPSIKQKDYLMLQFH